MADARAGREGTLEVRGRSNRVVHYEYVNGKRVFTKHTVKGNGNSMGTMGTELGTEKVVKGISNGMQVGRERFGLSTFRLSAERSNHAELPAPNTQGHSHYEIALGLL